MRWRRPRTIHPAVPELQEQLRTGDIDRREFLRTVTLLGVTASAAYAMVGRLTGQPLVPESRPLERWAEIYAAPCGSSP